MFVAIGGGGLISGIATAIKTQQSDVRVIGVETTGSTHAKQSVRDGTIQPRDHLDTIAEGIAAGRVSENTLSLLHQYVDEIVTVDDTDVTKALTVLADHANTVAEPAGAVPTAALLREQVTVTDENIVSVISGGNVGLTEFRTYVHAGLSHLDQTVTVQLHIRDWPTGLRSLAEAVETHGADIIDVQRDSRTAETPPTHQPVTVLLEGATQDQLRLVLETLEAHDHIQIA